MRQKYLSALWWTIKLQWKNSHLFFVWGIFESIFNGLRPIVQAYALAKLISAVSLAALRGSSSHEVYLWLATLLAMELLGQLVTNLNSLVRTRSQQLMDLVSTDYFVQKMYELSQEQFDNEAFNTKLDRARDALSQMWRVVDELSWAASSIIGFIGAITAILVVAPVLGVIILISIIPLASLQIWQNNRRERIYKKNEPQDRIAFRTRWMLVDPEQMPEIRLMNAFKHMLKIWRKQLIKVHKLDYENEKTMTKVDMLADTIQPVVSFGANVYFFRLLLSGVIGLDRFMFVRAMLEQATSGAITVANSAQRLHELSINLRNFSEVYHTKPAIPNGTVVVERPLTVEFKNVCFSYPGSDELALDDVSFLIVPGSQLALVGENGAGKSTLLKLLLRQYLPTSGTITVNGTDIKDVEQQSYYAAISNLSQNFLIVSHLTIRDNLIMGLDNEPNDEEIYQITDMVDATGFLKKLPHALNSRLDTSFDEGTNLSGGQNQRLGVARALLRNGDVMILDEPTSAIDAKAEYLIFNNIYKAHAGRTTLIVSHRFSTVRKAEKIIVMERGKITEYGSHEELLRHGGLYKEMFEAQAEGYK